VGWVCSVCGEEHEGRLRDIRLGLPEAVFVLGEAERGERAEVEDDWCRLLDRSGETRHFVRGLVHLPVRDEPDEFRFGVWVEVTRADFERLEELWHDPDGSESGPVFGALANQLAPYHDTVDLPVALQLRDVRILPAVIVLDAEHRLGADQRAGISLEAADRLAETVLH
jgi:hypothetical protein